MGAFKKPDLIIEKNIVFHPWFHKVYPMTLSVGAGHDQSHQRFASLPAERSTDDEAPSAIATNLFASALISGMFQDTLSIDTTMQVSQDSLKRPEPQLRISDSLKAQPPAIETHDTRTSQSQHIEEQVLEEMRAAATKIRASLVNRVTCIERQGALLWVGTENGLLKWNLSDDTFKIIELDLEKYKHITALKYDPEKQWLWVGTHKGLRRLKGDNWLADFNVGNGLSGNKINALFVNESGKLLLGTNEGINILDGDKWKVLANVDYGLTDDQVNGIYQGRDGTLWVCTDNGVCFRESGGNWQPFAKNIDLPSDTVLCMVSDRNGNKWFGTAMGLCKFDSKDRRIPFMTFDTAQKIIEDEILALSKDATNTLWCATMHGLSALKDGIWFTYDYSDGLPANSVNTILAGHDHKIYVGTYGGGLSILRSTGQKLEPVVDIR